MYLTWSLFFYPKKLETTSWWDLTIEKKTGHVYQLKAFGTTYTFYRLHYHPLFSPFLRVFALQNPRNVCKMEKEATEEKVTKQTYWTFLLFCEIQCMCSFHGHKKILIINTAILSKQVMETGTFRVAIVHKIVDIHFCRRVVPFLPTRPTAPRQ